jgi:4-hydroxybenzoate polyprenyltransferase and related prenyltransferases
VKRGLAASLVAALRPKHWVKNVFVFAPLVFAEQAGDPLLLARAVAAFLAFCALSSSVYLLNDVADRESDRLHPEKRRRPIAAGDLSVGAGLATAAVLATGGLAGRGVCRRGSEGSRASTSSRTSSTRSP